MKNKTGLAQFFLIEFVVFLVLFLLHLGYPSPFNCSETYELFL